MAFGAPAAAQPAHLVYRVDHATAVFDKRHLVITANGAVRSGGWDNARLLVLEPSLPEAKTLKVQFVARPPGPDEVVVQALLPIAARKVARLPGYGTVEIRIVAETNSIVVPITPR